MILHICTINNNHMMYGSWIWSVTDIIFCYSGQFFALLTPVDPENQNFQKNAKNT